MFSVQYVVSLIAFYIFCFGVLQAVSYFNLFGVQVAWFDGGIYSSLRGSSCSILLTLILRWF